ncbi:MAG TPA: sigma-70 family RNA polymerase sigma factor [Polyangiaceae bacterium]|nr:sigma-70 family RNA polymerase sigma factor [Polyangiaceae bacterium]
MLALDYDELVSRAGHPAMVEQPKRARSPEPVDAAGAESDESALIEAAIGGDERAARTIWVRYAPMVYGVVRRTLGPDGDSDDAVQEVFMRLFARLHQLEDRSALRSFIYSISIRVLQWKLRRRWVRRIMTLTPTGAMPDTPAIGVPPEAREAVRRLYRVLDQLGTTERTFFVLRNIERLTVEEIAAATKLSPSTVKRRIQRATDRADRLLEGDPVLSTYLQSDREASDE